MNSDHLHTVPISHCVYAHCKHSSSVLNMRTLVTSVIEDALYFQDLQSRSWLRSYFWCMGVFVNSGVIIFTGKCYNNTKMTNNKRIKGYVVIQNVSIQPCAGKRANEGDFLQARMKSIQNRSNYYATNEFYSNACYLTHTQITLFVLMQHFNY